MVILTKKGANYFGEESVDNEGKKALSHEGVTRAGLIDAH
jgi:hypothetical protein